MPPVKSFRRSSIGTNLSVYDELEERVPMMRCEDVMRELGAPTDSRDAAALADHLTRCSSCANFANRAALFDRLWDATRPDEPRSEVWENLWLQVAHSLDGSTGQEVLSPGSPAVRNGSVGSSVLKFNVERGEPVPPPSIRSRLSAAISIVGLSQAAAALLIVGLTWWFFIPSKTQRLASSNSPRSNSAGSKYMTHSLPSVDIEEGQLVVIVADPKTPSVVDRTPKGMRVGVEHAYLDWYGDERYFDWQQVFNEFESLAKPKVAME